MFSKIAASSFSGTACNFSITSCIASIITRVGCVRGCRTSSTTPLTVKILNTGRCVRSSCTCNASLAFGIASCIVSYFSCRRSNTGITNCGTVIATSSCCTSLFGSRACCSGSIGGLCCVRSSCLFSTLSRSNLRHSGI